MIETACIQTWEPSCGMDLVSDKVEHLYQPDFVSLRLWQQQTIVKIRDFSVETDRLHKHLVDAWWSDRCC